MSLGERGGKKHDPVGRGTWILAGATILAAVIGGIFLLASRAGGHAVPPASSATSGSHGKTSTTAKVVVRWQGPIGIGELGIDLDDVPPTVDPNSYTIWDVSGTLQTGINATFAAWTGAANPGYAQCHEWVLTHGTQQVQPTTGMQLCVLTAAGRTALVTITGLSNDDDTAEANATIWESAAAAAAFSSSPSTSVSAAVASVGWQGPIGIGELGIDLDDVPPAVDPNSYTIWDVSGTLQTGINATFAAWTGAANPGYAQCHEWVLTHGTQQVQPATGMQLCVLTAAGRTALVTITGLSNDDDTVEANATVWNLGS